MPDRSLQSGYDTREQTSHLLGLRRACTCSNAIMKSRRRLIVNATTAWIAVVRVPWGL